VARWLGAAAVTYPGRLGAESLSLLAETGLDLDPEGEVAAGRVIYRLRDPLPRARLIDTWRPAPLPQEGDGLEQFLDAVADGRHDPGAVVTLDAQPQPLPETGAEPLPRPEIREDGLNRVVIHAVTPRPALLLLADTSAPGWRVFVNDEPAPLLVADHMLRAVALSAGDHEIRFEYRDPAFALGRGLALGGLAVTLVLLAWPWIRRVRPETTVTGGE